MLEQQLRSDLVDRLTGHRAYRKKNPFANPVQLLSLDIARMLGQAEKSQDGLSVAQLTDLIQHITSRTFDTRMRNMRHRVEEIKPEENAARAKTALEALTKNPDGSLVSFETYQAMVEAELLGVVFTAHPTFALEADLYRDLAQLTTGRNLSGDILSDEETAELRQTVATRPHRPDSKIDLSSEFNLSLEAIHRFADAMAQVRAMALEVAASVYPDQWTSLQPKLLTASSWVGFDLDGRSDIGWADSMQARLRSALSVIDRYSSKLANLKAHKDAGDILSILDSVAARLNKGRDVFDTDLSVLTNDQLSELERAQDLSHRFVSHHPDRMTSLKDVRAQLQDAADKTDAVDLKTQLLTLSSEMASMSLGVGMVQVRLNASQLNNVARGLLGIERQPGDKASRRRQLKELEQRFGKLDAVTVGVSSLFAEKTTARRLMMFLRLVFDHIDSDAPIRFLVAEAESPLSMLTALYFAKLFGVEDRVDLSPLFETPLSLERGPGIIEELLEDPYFVEYVKVRGRLCVQAGYSDAGRFIGQPAAALAVERVRIKLAQLLIRHGLTDVEVVIFNTHGESMGRGAHPMGIAARLKYLASPESVSVFREAGITVLEEISFQGGDGYVHFLQPDLAMATTVRLLEARLDSLRIPAPKDALYEDAAFSLEFFLTFKEYQERLVEDPGYAAILSSFGVNLLYPTGSRMMQRQHEQPALVERSHPSQLRAIPHNAILQQLGFQANILAGMGRAADLDADRFKAVFDNSDRLQHVLALAAQAWQISSLDVMGAYLSIYDPETWLHLARSAEDETVTQEFEDVALLVSETGIYDRIRPTYQAFLKDNMKLRRAFEAVGLNSDLPNAVRDDVDILHAARQALIQHAFVVANRLPRFSSQPQITVSDILSQIIHLDMARALTTLRRAFPVTPASAKLEEYFDDEGYHFEGGQDYKQEHDHIFEPLEDIYDVLRRTGIGLSHVYSALG